MIRISKLFFIGMIVIILLLCGSTIYFSKEKNDLKIALAKETMKLNIISSLCFSEKNIAPIFNEDNTI